MSIVRGIARTALAGYFLYNGVSAVRRPAQDELEPWAQKILPVKQNFLPGALAAYLPQDATGLVRAHGVTEIVGGLALASGIGRRPGAALVAATLIPRLLASNPLAAPAPERGERVGVFVKNLALFGAAVLASMDTQGKPSLAHKAKVRKAESAQ